MQNSFPDMLKILRVHQVNATVVMKVARVDIAVIARENYREASMSFSVPDGRMAGIANSGSGL